MVHYFFCTASFFVLFFNLTFLKLKLPRGLDSAAISLQLIHSFLIPPFSCSQIIS
jgi:hypothetical protein